MKRFKFWFDTEHFGISTGTNASEAFKFFKDLGFVEDDVVELEIEVIK